MAVGLNAINIENSFFGAIGLYGAVTKSTISLNFISGESFYGISANADYSSAEVISSNTFLDNLFFGYTATGATIFFDTNTQKNLWLGPYTSAVNNGTGNIISKSLF